MRERAVLCVSHLTAKLSRTGTLSYPIQTADFPVSAGATLLCAIQSMQRS